MGINFFIKSYCIDKTKIKVDKKRLEIQAFFCVKYIAICLVKITSI